ANIEALAGALSFLVPGGQVRSGCAVVVTGGCPPASSYNSAAGLEHDTISTVPEATRQSWFWPSLSRRESYAPRRAILTRARNLVGAFTAANPRQWLAHAQYAYILLGLGDLAGADQELKAGEEAATIQGDRRTYY